MVKFSGGRLWRVFLSALSSSGRPSEPLSGDAEQSTHESRGGQPSTTSHFHRLLNSEGWAGKLHRSVTRTIRNAQCAIKFHRITWTDHYIPAGDGAWILETVARCKWCGWKGSFAEVVTRSRI